MFVLYHATIGLTLQLMYFNTSGQLFPMNIADTALVVVVTISMVVLFELKPEHFGDFRKEFKLDKLSQHYYMVLLAGRMLLAVMLVAMNSVTVVAFVGMVIPVADVVLLSVKKPYVRGYNNYRAIMN